MNIHTNQEPRIVEIANVANKNVLDLSFAEFAIKEHRQSLHIESIYHPELTLVAFQVAGRTVTGIGDYYENTDWLIARTVNSLPESERFAPKCNR